jgi:tRNA threonylcarbamoyladenosine biosynthesis protein TsaE
MKEYMRIYCQNHEATEHLAIKLAEKMPKKMVIYLYGDLGAGKSTFARAFIQALGFKGSVKSPTYTLLEAYPIVENKLAVHMDLYRIADPEEIDYLSLDDYEKNVAATLIEWPEKGENYIPLPDIKVIFSIHSEGRNIDFESQNTKTTEWLESLKN